MALLADSGLGESWWDEAATTVNYLGNRVLQQGKKTTSYEALFGVKSDVSHLRVFGCHAWVHVPTELRSKLKPRAAPGIFLGYTTSRKG